MCQLTKPQLVNLVIYTRLNTQCTSSSFIIRQLFRRSRRLIDEILSLYRRFSCVGRTVRNRRRFRFTFDRNRACTCSCCEDFRSFCHTVKANGDKVCFGRVSNSGRACSIGSSRLTGTSFTKTKDNCCQDADERKKDETQCRQKITFPHCTLLSQNATMEDVFHSIDQKRLKTHKNFFVFFHRGISYTVFPSSLDVIATGINDFDSIEDVKTRIILNFIDGIPLTNAMSDVERCCLNQMYSQGLTSITNSTYSGQVLCSDLLNGKAVMSHVLANIPKIVEGVHKNCKILTHFRSQVFPGVRLRFQETFTQSNKLCKKGTVNLFNNGKIVLIGIKSTEAANYIWIELCALMKRYWRTLGQEPKCAWDAESKQISYMDKEADLIHYNKKRKKEDPFCPPRVYMTVSPSSQFMCLDDYVTRQRIVSNIQDLLAHFYLDENQEAVEKIVNTVIDVRKRIGKNGQQKSQICFSDYRFAKTEDRAIVGFSVLKVLNELKIPRPLAAITSVCHLDSAKCILRIGDLLSINISHDIDDIGPEAHVETLCGLLSAPFVSSRLTIQLIQKAQLRWKLYGCRPHYIAGAALRSILDQMGKMFENVACLSAIAELLGCTKYRLKKIMLSIPSFYLRRESKTLPNIVFKQSSNIIDLFPHSPIKVL